MEIWIAMLALVALSIFAIMVYALQAIAVICKHGGVTIRIIQEHHYDNEPIVQESPMSEEEKKAIDTYNTQQSAFMSSIRNLQKIFIGEDQMPKEDKK